MGHILMATSTKLVCIANTVHVMNLEESML